MENNQKYSKSDKNSIEKYLKSNKNNLVRILGKKSILTNFPCFGRGFFKCYLDKFLHIILWMKYENTVSFCGGKDSFYLELVSSISLVIVCRYLYLYFSIFHRDHSSKNNLKLCMYDLIVL